jgi:hypothetical protein
LCDVLDLNGNGNSAIGKIAVSNYYYKNEIWKLPIIIIRVRIAPITRSVPTLVDMFFLFITSTTRSVPTLVDMFFLFITSTTLHVDMFLICHFYCFTSRHVFLICHFYYYTPLHVLICYFYYFAG